MVVALYEAREFRIEAVANKPESGFARFVEVAGWYWEPEHTTDIGDHTTASEAHVWEEGADNGGGAEDV